eukprot:TRINITY_DN11384_c0_g1_i5.p1 TRINITY_DN11384_c0_g1~~TRINITY_DN11384_c0_g1_i5.p1  ORF type:complete len:202 (-),score=68.85 TRINITY_DN11384_c0_g1_i5:235-792(-)
MCIRDRYELEKKAIAIEDLKLILKTYEKSYQEHIPIQTTFKSDEIVYTLQIRNYTTQQEEEKERKTNPFLRDLDHRKQERDYQRMVANITINEKKRSAGVKDFEKSASFAVNYIVTFFLAGLSGYYVGHYFLELDFNQSMILAIVVSVFTLLVETLLYIIKINAKDEKERRMKKSSQAPYEKKKK